MSTEEIDKLAEKIRPVIERMSLELYKKKPNDVVYHKIYIFKYIKYRPNL